MRKIIYLLLLLYFLILLISCSTQKKNENIVGVKEAQIQVEQVEDEVQEISNNSNISDISLVATDLTIIEDSDLEKEVVVVYSEAIKEVEDDDEDEEVEGFDVDDIKLLQDSVLFSAEGDSTIVTTGGCYWILYGFTFYESLDIRSRIGYYATTKEEKIESHWGIDVEYDWLKVYVSSHERIIKIRVDKNTTGKTRYWNIDLGAGDYFDRVHCQQPSM
jgi:hypothetical protein